MNNILNLYFLACSKLELQGLTTPKAKLALFLYSIILNFELHRAISRYHAAENTRMNRKPRQTDRQLDRPTL